MLILLVFGIPIFLCGFWLITYFKYQRYLYKFPGPIPIPILGNILSLQSGNIIQSFMNLQNKYGEIVNLTLGVAPRLIISGPEPIKFLLNSNLSTEKSDEYFFNQSWLGNGLILKSGPEWKTQRKLLTSGFHFSILQQFVEVFDKQSKVLIERLETTNGNFDVFPYIKLYTLDVICEAIMNIEVNAQLGHNSEYVKSIEHMMTVLEARMMSPINYYDFTYKLTDLFKEESKALKCLDDQSQYVINKTREKIRASSNNPDDNYRNQKPSFIDILLSAHVNGKPLSEELIKQEVNTFMFAGHDTVASGLSFLLYSLSKHVDIQEKCVREINEVAGGSTRHLTYNELRQFKYLDQVINESLRIYPPVVFVGRSLKKDACYDGRIWPKNVQITVFIYGLHHQPSLYPNPELFDPERFSAENSKNRRLYSYLPFSAGERNCIGQRFAMLEIKVTVVHILRKFKILPVPEHEPILAGGILVSKNGLLIRLQKRQ